MATFHGTLPQFDGNTVDWEVYTYRLQQYFTANDIKSAEKLRAILLSVCNSERIKLIQSVVSRENLQMLKFDEITKLVKDHFNPIPSKIISRFHFNSATHNPGETVASFITRLRKLTEHCNYVASLDEMIRDRLFCGIGNERLQRTLLAEKKFTFSKAYEMCQAYESAEKNAKALRKNSQLTTETIHVTTAKAPTPTGSQCHRCKGHHHPSTCRFKDITCNFCHKKGHITKACRTRKQQQKTSPSNQSQSPTKTGGR